MYNKILNNYKRDGLLNEDNMFNMLLSLECIVTAHEKHDPNKVLELLKDIHTTINGPHFDEYYGKHQVECMFHKEKNGSIIRGEKFCIERSDEILKNNYANFHKNINKWDMYVALNAQYHDYICIYRSFNPEDDELSINKKIIDSAIAFWFTDDDNIDENKIWEYFR